MELRLAKLESKSYQIGDEYGIVSLYNKITECCRTVEQHRWEWQYAPEGTGSIWVIKEVGTGEIVGHHGLIPIRLTHFDRTYLGGKTENTILHPKYLGTGIYFLHEKKFLKEAMGKFDLLYTTFGGGTPGKIRRKLGYDVVGKHINYIKITNSYALRKIIKRLIDRNVQKRWLKKICKGLTYFLQYFLMIFFLNRTKTYNDVSIEIITDIDSIGHEIDKFWTYVKSGFGVTIERTSKYLKWRIFNNPHVEYEFLLAKKQRKIVGYVITKSCWSNSKKGVIVDLVCEHNNRIMFSAILGAAVKRFIEADIEIVTFPTLDSNNFLNICIMRNGFLPIHKLMTYIQWLLKGTARSEDTFLLLKAINKDIKPFEIYNPYYWYYTELFAEGIN
jgi:hypothetical protein